MQGILLIARQPSIIESFTAMLSPAFRVFCADSPEVGYAALQERDNNIVAVLSELALARENGFTFAERMKEHSYFSLIPMIAISAELPVPEDMDCIEHGYFDLITAYAPQPLVYKRINNAIRARDSLSLTEVEKMLKVLPSSLSIGIALYPRHGTRFPEMFRAADRALYYVKNHGRAAHAVYDPDTMEA